MFLSARGLKLKCMLIFLQNELKSEKSKQVSQLNAEIDVLKSEVSIGKILLVWIISLYIFFTNQRLMPSKILKIMLVVKITNCWPTQIAIQLIKLQKVFFHLKQSVTNLEEVTSVLIGKALDGIESTHLLGPRFRHHPPNRCTVELEVLDGSANVQYQDWVKP